MQPICVIRSAVSGLLYINGRFAAEIGAGASASVPVSPQGALYIEFRPLRAGAYPLACKLVFSGGRPLHASLETETRLKAVCWPCGAVDIDLEPEGTYEPEPDFAARPEPEGARAAAIRTAEAIMEGAEYPGLTDAETARAIREADAVIPMQYALPSGEAAVGLVRALSPAFATVRALLFSADGASRVTRMWIE